MMEELDQELLGVLVWLREHPDKIPQALAIVTAIERADTPEKQAELHAPFDGVEDDQFFRNVDALTRANGDVSAVIGDARA